MSSTHVTFTTELANKVELKAGKSLFSRDFLTDHLMQMSQQTPKATYLGHSKTI